MEDEWLQGDFWQGALFQPFAESIKQNVPEKSLVLKSL
jgi:hypothetical protein